MLLSQAPLRGTDDWGDGAYGSSRGSRVHSGEDAVMAAGSLIMSPVSGVISSFGCAYSDDLSYRIVNIKDAREYTHRLFYVRPLDTIKVGDNVLEGALIGEAQDIAKRYDTVTLRAGKMETKLMKNHVHYEILNPAGKPVDPKEFI